MYYIVFFVFTGLFYSPVNWESFNKLPLFKKRRIGFTILGSFVTYTVIAAGCSVTGIAAAGMYSEQYYADVREAQELQEKKDKEEAEKKAREEAA